MLKKFYKKKLSICLLVFFSLLLVYIIPTKKELSIKEELIYVDKSIKTSDIFLLDRNNYLAKTKIITNKETLEGKIKELLESLIIDSSMQDNIPSGFKAIIPANTQILNIEVIDSLVKVNFSKDFLQTKEENEIKIIEAVVYTLTSLDNIKDVMIFIEGEILTYLPQSKTTLPSTLNRDIGINKEYSIISPNNISKTTVYYISKFNDNIYYVPVTKVNNDNRKKIEIIIDELSSNNVYKTNLMSYLNNNTKILSVNESDDELIVNFNTSIFNDVNDKQILEEVIYTISMSILDNYDVNDVVFNVEDEEIYKSVNKSIE